MKHGTLIIRESINRLTLVERMVMFNKYECTKVLLLQSLSLPVGRNVCLSRFILVETAVQIGTFCHINFCERV